MFNETTQCQHALVCDENRITGNHYSELDDSPPPSLLDSSHRMAASHAGSGCNRASCAGCAHCSGTPGSAVSPHALPQLAVGTPALSSFRGAGPGACAVVDSRWVCEPRRRRRFGARVCKSSCLARVSSLPSVCSLRCELSDASDTRRRMRLRSATGESSNDENRRMGPVSPGNALGHTHTNKPAQL